MKKTNKSLLLLISVLMLLLFLPVLAKAAAVSWTSEQYMVDAGGLHLTTPEYGPPLPVSDSYQSPVSIWNRSNSLIIDTSMDVSSRSRTSDFTTKAVASFSGIYLATATTPLFQFIYDGTYTSLYPSCYGICSDRYAWLTVSDLTTSTTLYDNQSLTLDGNYYTIGVSTLSGHDISVDFGAYVRSTADTNTPEIYESITLNYSMAVVPEPISSILFVTGGTLLAGRRYMKRKKEHKNIKTRSPD